MIEYVCGECWDDTKHSRDEAQNAFGTITIGQVCKECGRVRMCFRLKREKVKR